MRNVAAELNGSPGRSFLGRVGATPAAGHKVANCLAIRDLIRTCLIGLQEPDERERPALPSVFSLAEMPRIVEDSEDAAQAVR